MDLIYREKLANKLTALDMPKGIEKEQYFIVMCNVIHALFEAPVVENVPLDVISRKMAENYDYPSCQDNVPECQKCELREGYGNQVQCWKKYLKSLIKEYEKQEDNDGSD